MLLKLYKIQGSKTIVKLVCLYYNPGIFSDLNLVMKCVHFLVTIKNLQSWLSKQKVTKRPMGCITHLSNNSKYQLYAIIYKMSGQWSKIIRSSTKRFSIFLAYSILRRVSKDYYMYLYIQRVILLSKSNHHTVVFQVHITILWNW